MMVIARWLWHQRMMSCLRWFSPEIQDDVLPVSFLCRLRCYTAAVVGAEAAYTGINARPGTPGVPAMVPTLIGTVGSVASALLIRVNPDVAFAGCLTGLGCSGYMMYTYINRIQETPYNPEDWPGAKSWPAMMTLITFFIFMAYVQGITQSM